EGFVFDVADEERELRMGRPRLRDHLRAEIDPDAERGLERGEQIAGAAAEFEHTRALGDEKLEVAQVLLVEERGAFQPFAALTRARVGGRANPLLQDKREVVTATSTSGNSNSLLH